MSCSIFINMTKIQKIGRGIKDAKAVEKGPKEFANLTYDPGFKIVLGTEGKSEKLLMHLLNRILKMNIVSLQYLPTERLGLTEEESKSFFDVYCKDSSGKRFLIEMQMWSQHYFHKRAVYYSSLSVQDQARVEKIYQKETLKRQYWNYYFAPVYVVSFLNFPNNIVEINKEDGNPYISHYVYKSKDTNRELGDETNIIFVDLEKFRKEFDECADFCEKWLYSIRNMHLLKECPNGVKGTELEELYKEAKFAAWPSELRSQYERYTMNQNDYGNILEEHYEDGFSAGHVEGRAEGRAETIRKMVAGGVPLEVIANSLGLSIAEIKEIL